MAKKAISLRQAAGCSWYGEPESASWSSTGSAGQNIMHPAKRPTQNDPSKRPTDSGCYYRHADRSFTFVPPKRLRQLPFRRATGIKFRLAEQSISK